MKILVTGFEPFGGETINPSGMVAGRLTAPEGHALEMRILPVGFKKIDAAMDAALSETAPDIVLSLGQAGGRRCVTPEMVAINLASTVSNDCERLNKDDHGFSADDLPVIAGAPDAYFSTVDARKAVRAARAAGIDAAVSFSAGAYLCNYVMFRFIHLGKAAGFRSGFVHLPYLPEQAEKANNDPPSIPLDAQVRAVQAIINSLVK